MNAGTLSMITYVSIAILIFSGWWRSLLRRIQLSRTVVVSWLTLFVMASLIHLSPANAFTVNLGFPFMVAFVYVCWRKAPSEQHLTMFSTVTLSGSVCYFIREIAMIDPALLLFPAMWLQAVVTLLLVVMAIRGIWGQIAVLCGGITLGYTMSLFGHMRAMPMVLLGDGAFFDLLWLTFSGLLVIDGLVQTVKRWTKPLRSNRGCRAFTVASQRKSRYD